MEPCVDGSVYFQMEEQRGGERYDLTDHCGIGCAFDPHCGKSQQAIDQNRVEDDIGGCAQDLCDRGTHGMSGGLEHLFKDPKEAHAEGKYTADAQIVRPHLGDDRVCCL